MTHDTEPQDRLHREQKITIHDYNSAYYNKAVNCGGACGYVSYKIFVYVLVLKVCLGPKINLDVFKNNAINE